MIYGTKNKIYKVNMEYQQTTADKVKQAKQFQEMSKRSVHDENLVSKFINFLKTSTCG